MLVMFVDYYLKDLSKYKLAKISSKFFLISHFNLISNYIGNIKYGIKYSLKVVNEFSYNS